MKFLTELVIPSLDHDSKVTAPSAGSIYFNTVSKTVRVFNGTTWADLGFAAETDEVLVGPDTPVVSSIVLWVDTVPGETAPPGTTLPPGILAEDEIHIGSTTPDRSSNEFWIDPLPESSP